MKEKYYYNTRTHKFSNTKNDYDVYGNSKPILASSVDQAEKMYNKRKLNDLKRAIKRYQNTDTLFQIISYNNNLAVHITCTDFKYVFSPMISANYMDTFLQKLLIECDDFPYTFFTKIAYQNIKIKVFSIDTITLLMGGKDLIIPRKDLLRIFPKFQNEYFKYYLKNAKSIFDEYNNLSDDDKLKIEIIMNEGD